MRAYMAPDGSPADYAEENVPYHPKKVIKVAPRGVNEEDFVFILGFPGRTYRHRTSHYLAYEEEIRMPYVADWYQWQIDVMEKAGANDRAIALKHLSRIKGLSNTMKNYRGKLKGLGRLHLVNIKRDEEKELQRFIESDPKRKELYGTVLQEIGTVYDEMRKTADRDLVLGFLARSSSLLSNAYTIYEAAIELQKKDLDRESAYMDRNFPRTRQYLLMSLQNYYEPTDRILFKEMLMRAARLPEGQRITAVDQLTGNETAIDAFIEKAYAESKLADGKVIEDALKKSPEQIKKMKDPFIRLAEKLYPLFQEQRETNREQQGKLNRLYGLLTDVKEDFLATDFIPDANGTLRFTYGRIRGYEPMDAVYYNPLTTADGVLEKTTGEDPFDTPKKLIDLIKARDFGQFEHPQLKSVPVAMLYNMDTTGGNSGSAVLNARGELVGINFDRAFEATINDYAWSEAYSRSIAVDIRYVLWVTQKFGGAGYLLQEMGVPVR
jgi:hypothetical protein